MDTYINCMFSVEANVLAGFKCHSNSLEQGPEGTILYSKCQLQNLSTEILNKYVK